MTATGYGTNDPRTQKMWSRKLFEYALKDFFFLNFGWLGTGPESVIQVHKDLDGANKSGDKVTFEMETPLSGEGNGNDGTVTGAEEAGSIQNMTVTLGERSHGLVSRGKISEKRTLTDFNEYAARQLGIWTRNVAMEPDLWRMLYGLYNASGIETVNELEPSANRIIYGGQTLAGVVNAAKTTDALLSAETATDYLCGLQFLSLMKRRAKLCTPKIRPVTIDGKRYYLVVLHPYQMKAVRASTGEHSFVAMMKDAEKRGKDNPIFAGAEFYYDEMIVYEYDRAPLKTGANGTTPSEGFWLNAGRTATTDPVANGKSVAAGLILGAQAGVLEWGQQPRYYNDMVDVKRKPQAAVDMLYAMKKTRFNVFTEVNTNTAQEDYGVYQFHTQVQLDS